MSLKNSLTHGLVTAALAVLPSMSFAAAPRKCVAGPVTAESYTWNFSAEAAGLLKSLQEDAAQMRTHAAILQTFTENTNIDKKMHSYELSRLREKVNDMGKKLCRLEVIRSSVSPWEQKAIDETAPSLRLLADNVQDAILFLRNQPLHTWSPTYRMYANNMYKFASQISTNVDQLEKFAAVHARDQQLEQTTGMNSGS